jgi:hypothetical protein
MNKISPSRSDFVAERWGQRSLRYHFKLVDKSEFERKKGAVSCNFETAPLFLGFGINYGCRCKRTPDFVTEGY